MAENKDYKKIVELDNEAEAGFIEAELKKREIPHNIRSYFDVAFDGIFQMQKGWGVIEAPVKYEKEIKKIYKDLSLEEKSQEETFDDSEEEK